MQNGTKGLHLEIAPIWPRPEARFPRKSRSRPVTEILIKTAISTPELTHSTVEEQAEWVREDCWCTIPKVLTMLVAISFSMIAFVVRLSCPNTLSKLILDTGHWILPDTSFFAEIEMAEVSILSVWILVSVRNVRWNFCSGKEQTYGRVWSTSLITKILKMQTNAQHPRRTQAPVQVTKVCVNFLWQIFGLCGWGRLVDSPISEHIAEAVQYEIHICHPLQKTTCQWEVDL